mgnify:CR=1 FL=1
MDYGKEQCVGCDPSTYGEYRPGMNWHLCDECYNNSLALDKENELFEKKQEEENK